MNETINIESLKETINRVKVCAKSSQLYCYGYKPYEELPDYIKIQFENYGVEYKQIKNCILPPDLDNDTLLILPDNIDKKNKCIKIVWQNSN